jgi:hypothetical protein
LSCVPEFHAGAESEEQAKDSVPESLDAQISQSKAGYTLSAPNRFWKSALHPALTCDA